MPVAAKRKTPDYFSDISLTKAIYLENISRRVVHLNSFHNSASNISQIYVLFKIMTGPDDIHQLDNLA